MKGIIGHIEDWKAWMRVKNQSPATIKSYGYQIKHLAVFLSIEGVGKVEDVDKECLRRYWHWLKTSPKAFSHYSLGVKCRAAKSLFAYLSEHGITTGNPSEVLKAPDKRLRLPKQAPAYKKVIQVLEAADTSKPNGIRDRAFMEVMYSNGLRCKECENLSVFDVDIQGGTVRINQGKGRKDREVPLGIEASRWLRRYLEEVRPLYRARCPEPTDRLWLNWHGLYLSSGTMQTVVRKYRLRAGCDFPITPHAFRRAMATGMLSHGADLHSIGSILGHASVRTTALYAQALGQDVKRTHDATHPRQRSTEASDQATPRFNRKND